MFKALLISSALLGMTVALSGCQTMGFGDDGLAYDAPYGSIAYSDSTRAWAVVSDLPTPNAARASAVATCGFDDCKALTVFGKGICATIALDGEWVNPHYQWALNKKPQKAKSLALQRCEAGGGADCRTSPPVCN
ncbi:MAG: DUF4189 domain-containing protein [Magnetovibrionaceae bacterium]